MAEYVRENCRDKNTENKSIIWDAERLSEHSGIRKEVILKIQALAECYGMESVILFGSRARGNYRKTSDIDLAVQGGDFVPFALDVDESTDTLLKYDIVDMQRPVNPELLLAIRNEGICFYENELFRNE